MLCLKSDNTYIFLEILFINSLSNKRSDQTMFPTCLSLLLLLSYVCYLFVRGLACLDDEGTTSIINRLSICTHVTETETVNRLL